MPSYNIGDLIKKLRKQKGISQEDLAYPIIDRATLSKIENGKAAPHRKTLEYLFERLGYDPDELVKHFMMPDDLNMQLVVDELSQLLSYVMRAQEEKERNEFCNKVENLISQLDGSAEYKAHPLNRQFLLDAKARLAYNRREDDKAIALAKEALAIVIPNFCVKGIAGYYLNKSSRNMITLLAMIYNEANRYNEAIEILYGIKENVDNTYKELAPHARVISPYINNLGMILVRAGRYQEAYDICEEGINVCHYAGEHKWYKAIAWHQAHALIKMGKKEEGIELARKLHCAFDLYKQNFAKNTVRETVLAETGVDVAAAV